MTLMSTKWLLATGFQGRAHQNRSNVVCTQYFPQSASAWHHLTQISATVANCARVHQPINSRPALVNQTSWNGIRAAFANQSSGFFGVHQHLNGHPHGSGSLWRATCQSCHSWEMANIWTQGWFEPLGFLKVETKCKCVSFFELLTFPANLWAAAGNPIDPQTSDCGIERSLHRKTLA